MKQVASRAIAGAVGSDVPHIVPQARREYSRRSILGAMAGIATGMIVGAGGRANQTIVLGQVSLSFYAVVGAVLKQLLENIGHGVEVREGSHEQIFPMLANDEIDLMVAAWLPEGHAGYWKQFGRNALEVTRLYEGARFYWAVPQYVPFSAVESIADLAKPDVSVRMFADIQAIGPGATITTASNAAIERYGLSRTYRVLPGTASAWLEAYRRLLDEKRWFVFPGWAPQFLNKADTLRELRDPLGALGGVNHAALVSPARRYNVLPVETRRILSRVRLDLTAVNDMDWAVNVQRASPQEAASIWIEANIKRYEGWLEGTPIDTCLRGAR